MKKIIKKLQSLFSKKPPKNKRAVLYSRFSDEAQSQHDHISRRLKELERVLSIKVKK